MYDGVAVPVIDCKHCGALIDENTQTILPVKSQMNQGLEKDRLPLVKGSETWLYLTEKNRKHGKGGFRFNLKKVFTVLIMVSIITFVWASCIFVFIPAMMGTSYALLNMLICTAGTAIHWASITSYLQVSFGEGGSAMKYMQLRIKEEFESLDNIPKKAFQNYQWCSICNYVKPPSAHHCRRCGVCVVDLDHHCTFTSSCIGRDNLCNFMRFLKVTCFGSWIAASVCLAQGYSLRHQIWQHCIQTRKNYSHHWFPIQLFTYSTRWFLGAPWKLSLWEMTLVLSLTGSIGIYILILRQNKLMKNNTTYLEQKIRKRSKAFRSNQRIL